MFKMDYYKEGSLVPLIKFNIYDARTKKEINLTVCNDVNIKIISITPNCEVNCEYLRYDTDKNINICKCEIKINVNILTENQFKKF